MSGELLLTPSSLWPLIGTPRCPVIVDIVLPDDFAADPRIIPGATRRTHDDVAHWAPGLAGRDCVIVCQKGLKLSQGIAARLQWDGIAARALAGGMVGWCAEPTRPAIPVAALPGTSRDGRLWTIGSPLDPQALACAWLILRFVAADARILCVAPDQTVAVAQRFGAGLVGHHDDGRAGFSELCAKLQLRLPGLEMIAERLDRGATLLMLCQALIDLHGTPRQSIDAALPMFDALYRAGTADATGVAA